MVLVRVEGFGGHVKHGVPANEFSGFRDSLWGDFPDWQVQLPEVSHWFWFPRQGCQSHYYRNVQVNLPQIPNSKLEENVHLRGIREIHSTFLKLTGYKSCGIHISFDFTCVAPGKFRLTMADDGTSL